MESSPTRQAMMSGISFWAEPPSSKPGSGRRSSNAASGGRRGGRSTGRNSPPRRNCDRSSCRGATRTLSRWPASPGTGRCSPPARGCGSARSACCGSPRRNTGTGNRYLDFDTGRTFQPVRGNEDAADWGEPDDFGSRITAWYRRNGIDVHQPGSPRRSRSAALAGRRQPMGYPRGGGPESRAVAARPGSYQLAGALREDVDRLQVRRAGDIPLHDPRRRTRYRPGLSARIRMPIGIECDTGCGSPPQAEPQARAGGGAGPAKSAGTPFGTVVTATLEPRRTGGRACWTSRPVGRRLRQNSCGPMSWRTCSP